MAGSGESGHFCVETGLLDSLLTLSRNQKPVVGWRF